MNLVQKLFSPYKKFAIYHLRWQMGLILTPFMYLLIDVLHLPTAVSMILFNIVGATVFFPIDKLIFNARSKSNETEVESNQKIK